MWKTFVFGFILLGFGIWLGSWLSVKPMASLQDHATHLVYRCPMHPLVLSDKPGTCSICRMDLILDKDSAVLAQMPNKDRTIAYWRSPKDTSYTSDKPGKSPLGIDLIPVYEDKLSLSGIVKIDPATVQNIGVKTIQVERRSLNRTVRALGRVNYDETRMRDVNTKVSGWVEKLFVDYTGQKVHKGKPLLELYSPELVVAQEEYLMAIAYKKRLGQDASDWVLAGALDVLEAAAQRLRYWDITHEQIADLKQSGEVKRTMTIFSPQEGVVVHKEVFAGAYINAGQSLYRMADLTNVWIYVDIYEYELQWVKLGQDAAVKLSYLPGQIFHGRVAYIYPFLEAKTRTAKVRIEFPNPEGLLKPEMYANVELQVPLLEATLVVPNQAVIRSGTRSIVVAHLGEGRFKPYEVLLGTEADGYYQILAGLQEGMEIVTSAQFLIDSESNLNAAVQKLSRASNNTEPEQH